MKSLLLATAIILLIVDSGAILAQPGPTPTPYPSNTQSAPNQAESPGSAGPRTTAPRMDDRAMGAGAATGTAHPNTTGSSGSSGTSGVDASTGNSH
jgi:hypothetical protein